MLKNFLFLLFFPFISFAQSKVGFSKPDSADIFVEYGDGNILKKANDLIENVDAQAFLTDFHKKYPNTFDKDIRYVHLISSNVDDWEMKLYDERKSQLAFLKNYLNFPKLNPEFQSLVEANIRWNYWHLLLAYSIIRGLIVNWWPYWFINPNEKAGVVGMLEYIVGIMVFLLVVASALIGLQRLTVRVFRSSK
jgi:hypothetical protein